MNLGIVDIIILIFILMGGIVGFKEGAIKKGSSIIGLILVVVLSFTLKNPLSVFFYENLPFFDLWGVFKGVQVLNILFYELLSFVIIMSVLSLVLRIILKLTGIIEKVLKATIILSIPSKIIGFFIGLIESYVWVYIFLFILTLPVFNIKGIEESRISNYILHNTPVISKYTNKTLEVYNDLYTIIDNRSLKTNEDLNEEALDLMLKYDVVTKESANKLVTKNKIMVKNPNKYN